MEIARSVKLNTMAIYSPIIYKDNTTLKGGYKLSETASSNPKKQTTWKDKML